MKKSTKTKAVIDINSIPLGTLCKWQALHEAVNLIADKCHDKGMDFEKITIKPLDVLDYIEQKADVIEYKISCQEKFELLKSPGKINLYG